MHPRRSPLSRSFRALARAGFLAGLALALAAGCGDNINPGSGDDDPGTEPDAGTGTDVDGGVEPDAGVEPGPVVVTCAAEIPAATEGSCDVTPGEGGAVLLRGTVLGLETVYENGAVLYEGNTITCTGCDCGERPEAADATRVDCAGAVISPGLINPHDHITYTEGAPIDHGETRYEHRHGWRGTLSTPQNPHGGTSATGAGIRWGEVRMMMSGVTSIVGSGGATGLVRNLDRNDDARAVGLTEAVEFETFPLGDANETFRSACGWNYSIEEAAAAALPAFLPHVAEGINDYAAEEFRCESTSFDGGRDFTEANDAHIHSIALDAAGYARMARDGTRLIWSPRSNISLYGVTAMVSTFARLGGVVALGTDWTYSGSVNMVRELACADEYNRDHLNGYFSDRDLWLMATQNAALATHTDARLGSLAEDKLADIAIYTAEAGQHHRAVLEATAASTILVLINGRPAFGEADVVAGLGEECEAVDVCDAARAICLDRELGTTYADLAAEVSTGEAAYPAFFCGAPDDEPTCVPSRPDQFTGVAAADDPDGDGVTGGDDNCPSVFNPIRPIDGDAQADADEDGEGDACDATPTGEDLDGDGVANADDNCPFDVNPDQADGDRDDKGDVCDFCPEQANPSSVCEPQVIETTIGAIQRGDVAEGTRVSVLASVVTAVRARDLFIQDPEGGTSNAGVHVFLSADASGIAIGDVVDVTGEVDEYFDDTEVAIATVTRVGGGGAITPVELTAEEATDEVYEGMLVTVTDVTDVVNPYDCSVDGPSCTDANLWEVNGQIVVYDRVYLDTDWAAQAGQGPVTGVMGFRFERRRLMPRTADDIGGAGVRLAPTKATPAATRAVKAAKAATKKIRRPARSAR